MSKVVPSVLAVHDLCGFGRCSLSVAIPILSVMGVQCVTMPTAYFSTPTNYDEFTFLSLEEELPKALRHWQTLNVSFAGIYSGFMASETQMELVMHAAKLYPDARLIVDPVMGDHGKIYRTYTKAMCDKMLLLSEQADVITPNTTEASLLMGISPDARPGSVPEALRWLETLNRGGTRSVVITGLTFADKPGKLCCGWFDRDSGEIGIHEDNFAGQFYHGTGDVFASVLTATLLRGGSLLQATAKAARFVRDCAGFTFEQKTEEKEGVLLEALLPRLLEN